MAVGREYILYGQINVASLSFSTVDGLPPGIKVRELRYVVKVPVFDGTEQWRIEGPVPDPILTVEAAIQYVTRARVGAESPAIRRNAGRTLASLRHFR